MTDLEKKVRGLVFVLLTIMEETVKLLQREETFAVLTEDAQSEVIMEFLIFNQHQFNRTLFAWLGETERNRLMDGVLIELCTWLAKENNRELSKRYNQLTVDTFGEYLEYLTFQTKLENLPHLYNEREEEYANYRDTLEEGEGLAGTVLWEFGNKIAEAMHRNNDLAIIMKAQLLGAGWTHFADAMKQAVSDG